MMILRIGLAIGHYLIAMVPERDIDQCQCPRTHCNYKEYMDFGFMSSNLLKNIVYSGSTSAQFSFTDELMSLYHIRMVRNQWLVSIDMGLFDTPEG